MLESIASPDPEAAVEFYRRAQATAGVDLPEPSTNQHGTAATLEGAVSELSRAIVTPSS